MSQIRYAITMVERNGLRVLATPNQGRYHKKTREEAEAYLKSLLKNPESTLKTVFGDITKLRVDEIECYDSGDSKRAVFGFDDEKP